MQPNLKLDPNFKPAYEYIQDFLKKAQKQSGGEVKIALERNDGFTYIYQTLIIKNNKEDNLFYLERMIKSLLWLVGGFKIYFLGPEELFIELKKMFSKNGLRKFDVGFMEKVYEQTFEVVLCDQKSFPKRKDNSVKVGRNLNGNRIGFDAGGSDVKISAVINGEAIFSEEIVWLPKVNSDPNYHYEIIKNVMKKAAEKMPSVDAVGISSAGIYVNNKVMAASLFIEVPEKAFKEKVKNMYVDIVKELFGDVPLEVANDGDVTALAGSMDLKADNILGIAMGTSEAAGYIDKNGNILGWLNELAFVPVDYHKDAMVDEWSGDYGCGVKYFSQDSVIKLAKNTSIVIDEKLTPAQKLKIVQKLSEENHPEALEIFSTIGYYLGYAIAFYGLFYEIDNMLLLGRVTSGIGGNLIVEKANEVINNSYPHLKHIKIHMPDEMNRRVGQSIAAASLPKLG
ncbi:MAG: ROK family protein [Erysipelotrichales bacterium]|nr:ROK family protein [Erysipelotrichales bacterium]